MNILNVISKVRFNSARPQRIHLEKCGKVSCELLCLEPGQENVAEQNCAYYVIAGSGQIKTGQGPGAINPGCLVSAEDGKGHTIVNNSDQRLICLVVSNRS